MVDSFRCASLSPIHLSHPRLAVETARAGGVGVLDAVHIPAALLDRGRANLRQLFGAVPSDGAVRMGLRLHASHVGWQQSLVDTCAGRPHWVLICGWTLQQLPALLSSLDCQGREIWLEVGASGDLEGVDSSLPFAGWAARGAECGGLTGTESAFILTQHLALQRRPFLIRGGIGLHSAAACRVAGAAGVILDDVLWLLRESPLPPRWRHLIARFGVADTVVFGRHSKTPVRVVDRPDVPAARALGQALAAIEMASVESRPAAWQAAIDEGVGWDDPERRAWPLGEATGSAGTMATRYRTVGRLVRAVLEAVDDHIALSAERAPLAPESPLARAHGTRYPIVQGPMTRVSDRVEFASEIAANGGLPMVALALMRGPEVEALLEAAHQALDGRAWGVGILGFVPPALRSEQLEIVKRVRPPFALISGGRPDQAADLEALGIKTYLHAPAPLLRPFIDEGATRFVFEGGECGGHVGPMHSFSLWDFAVDTLAEQVSAHHAPAVHVLFAGGIHDALSAAMVAALAAPLAACGMKVGVLMGTAYLFTREAVDSAAITTTFQRQALVSRKTATIETGPGHIIRCAQTPFAEGFVEERRALRQSGLAGSALRDALETLVVGRGRIASKGLERDGDRLVAVGEARQLEDGMYMLGDLAALRDTPTSIARLHDDVSVEGSARLRAAAHTTGAGGVERPAVAAAPVDIAIIGASCLVPGARDLETFWRNLLDQVKSITEIPAARWDWRLYFDADPAARDRIYSRHGGFVDPIPFDPLRFGIPPKSLAAITTPQLLALELTRRALVDAGLGDFISDGRLRSRTSVVFGTADTGDIEQLYMARGALPLLIRAPGEPVLNRLPEWTEESYPGMLVNVVAGRVANRFDLGGINLTVDAACASSLAALDLAVRELAEHRSDLVIAGGIEFDLSPQSYMGFSRTRALSPRGRADVFDRDADGIVISEGAVVVVLKRLADAQRDGDRIYAVIKGVAGSSDGRGLSLTAPKPQGQRRAIDRAYAMAGISPSSIGLYEAHGTGTALGDAAEVETITRAIGDHGGHPGECVIGSVKSLLGHTRTAAGMVAMLKAALSLHHGVLPPHAGVTRPLQALAGADAPVRLLSEPQPWLSNDVRPRRAGVSAFGFGGTNYHVVLEEHRDAHLPGAAAWPLELFVLASASRDALLARLARLDRAAQQIEEQPQDGREVLAFSLRDLAYVCAVEGRDDGAWRAALIAGTAMELRRGISHAIERLSSEGGSTGGLFLGSGPAEGRLAFLFPGQGSQYPGMGRELALYSADVRRTLETADALFDGLPDRLSRLTMPGAAFDEDSTARQKRQLAHTLVAQPAIGALSCAMLDLARRVGLEPSCAAGHSYGELVALHAAGSLRRDDVLKLSAARARAMSAVDGPPGAMAMVALAYADVLPYLDGTDDVRVANLNAPDQVVLSGASDALTATIGRLRADGHTVMALAVSAAFHSPLMAPARPLLEEALAAAAFTPPTIPVYANLDGRPYPNDVTEIRRRLSDHLQQRVDFVAQVETMYGDGVRLFVELGPGRVLSGLVKRILADRPHLAITADGGLRGWLSMMAEVFVAGHSIDAAALFEDRPAQWIDLDRLPETRRTTPEWLIDGGRVWPRDATTRHAGAAAFLNDDSADLPTAPEWSGSAPGGSVIAEAYRAYESAMRHFLDQQERMLAHALQREGGALPVVDASPVEPARPVLVPPAPPARIETVAVGGPPHDGTGISRERLIAWLLGIVSERTGYATDVLGLDLDLEADLGIDSIKRIEIITTLSRALPTVAHAIRDQVDRLSRQRSLNAIADVLLPLFATRPVSEMSTGPEGEQTADECGRFTMRGHAKPLGSARSATLAGLHVVTEDASGVAPLVVDALRRLGADACSIPVEVLGDTACLKQRLADLRARHGPVRGVVHATAIGRSVGNGGDTMHGWRRIAVLATKQLFQLLQDCAPDLERASDDPVVLAVTAMGGDWGRTAGGLPGSEMAGGAHGILRSFAREYPNVCTLVVDVEVERSAEELAAIVTAEYLAGADDCEVGYRGGRRTVFTAKPAPISSSAATEAWKPQAGWTVLATGGARGITAELCRDLAVTGVRLILVGRGRDPIEHGAASAETSERSRHIDVLRHMGVVVEYHAVDVRNEAAFGGLIEETYRRFGRIDAVLHGAGVIEDQRFSSKTAESFDRVFDTKVDGALILMRHLRPEGLKWLVFFGSISGRFGNQGQADYAAANETLNRLAWRLARRWPATRVVSINWGPWRGAGMASDAVQGLLAAQGIQVIDVPTGRKFFATELGAGAKDDIEVVAGHGPWKTAEPIISREEAAI